MNLATEIHWTDIEWINWTDINQSYKNHFRLCELTACFCVCVSVRVRVRVCACVCVCVTAAYIMWLLIMITEEYDE